ncbi:unnamed protein product [Medioppia subpectinata]|uniref:Tetraspanin n=1 Tax=Medioppia subpectinata TaxID=1979941 RepID=A0A7R9Q0B0_9ACAR|nr:unnamed protein product [Medioppia subpectinata]CAG2107068.1 unnamed protein product [Medioppia subpectinata]
MLSCIKYIVVFYNFLFWLLGVVILGLSAYLWWDSQNYLDLNEVGQYYVTPFIVLLILGGVMTIVGFLGCCGAVRESSCLLGTYFLFCVTMCVACGASLFWAIHNESTVRDKIARDTQKLILVNYGSGNTNATEMLVDRIQRDFDCCGSSGPADWLNASYNKENKSHAAERGIGASTALTPIRIPHSCCLDPTSRDCERDTERVPITPSEIQNLRSIHQTGCVDKFETFIKEKWQWILITGGILIGVQVFALIFACVLCCAISRVGDK